MKRLAGVGRAGPHPGIGFGRYRGGRVEVLGHRLAMDAGHLTSEFASYYKPRRAHMEREHLPPVREEPEEVATLTLEQIEVKSYVGGLVKSFERKAA